MPRLEARARIKDKIREIVEIGKDSAFDRSYRRLSGVQICPHGLGNWDSESPRPMSAPPSTSFTSTRRRGEGATETHGRGKLRVEAVKARSFEGTVVRYLGVQRYLGSQDGSPRIPDRCVGRYAMDREQGVNAEAWAAAQLKKANRPDPMFTS
jgi:hypothetical protein